MHAILHLKDEETGRLQLGYGDALTTNTAQGTTVTEHIHAMPAGSRLVSAFGAYTSGSRHREQSFIVTSEGAERAELVARRPLGDQREIARGDIVANITRNFAQAPEKESALDMIERAAALRRGTIQAVQRSLQSMEIRAAQGRGETSLSERLTDRRIIGVLDKRMSVLAEQLRRRRAALVQAVRKAVGVVEKLSEIARRRGRKRLSEAEYWRATQRRREGTEPVRDRATSEEQNKRHTARR